MGAKNKYTTSYHAQTNGHVERMNRTLASMLRHYIAENQRAWDLYLPWLGFAYNSTVHRATQTTPFELILSRPPRPLALEDLDDDCSPSYSRAKAIQTFRAAYCKAKSSLLAAQRRYKKYFDKLVKQRNSDLKVGDSVYLDARDT